MIYPWQINQWQQLISAKQANRLPHAILMSGAAGLGKAEFAHQFSRLLLCQQTDHSGMYCHPKLCPTCRLIEHRTHPNVLWVEPEKETIQIEQIRHVSEFVQQTVLKDGCRVIIFHPASAMNAHAANALLKTLEEPSSGTLFILLCDQNKKMPATLYSRCQHIKFALPKRELAIAFLQSQLTVDEAEISLFLNRSDGAPLKALAFAQNKKNLLRKNIFSILYLLSHEQSDPLQAIKRIAEVDLLHLLDLVLSWQLDVLRLQLGGDYLTNEDYQIELKKTTEYLSLSQNVRLMASFQELRKQICSGVHLNIQLTIENIFIQWGSLRCS